MDALEDIYRYLESIQREKYIKIYAAQGPMDSYPRIDTVGGKRYMRPFKMNKGNGDKHYCTFSKNMINSRFFIYKYNNIFSTFFKVYLFVHHFAP